MRQGIRIAAAVLIAFVAPAGAAIFKCEQDGKVIYSDKGCSRPPAAPLAAPPTPAPAPIAVVAPPAPTPAEPPREIKVDIDSEGHLHTTAVTPAASAAAAPSSSSVISTVPLLGGKALLKIPDTLRYLDPAESTRVLEKVWGNPPGSGSGVLGMLFPAGVAPEDEDSWGVVITYAGDGYVSDEDADKTNYTDLLHSMQEDTQAANEERRKQKYPAITLAGWAESPHYDRARHKIYWAKDLIFEGNEHHTLNYAIRVLGRAGVLELNAVANVRDLDRIKREMEKIVGYAEFAEGNRYADFNGSTDKIAAYGLAALVAGGVAAKTGLLAKLFALVLAAKKIILLAVAGVGAAVAKLLKKKT